MQFFKTNPKNRLLLFLSLILVLALSLTLGLYFGLRKPQLDGEKTNHSEAPVLVPNDQSVDDSPSPDDMHRSPFTDNGTDNGDLQEPFADQSTPTDHQEAGDRTEMGKSTNPVQSLQNRGDLGISEESFLADIQAQTRRLREQLAKNLENSNDFQEARMNTKAVIEEWFYNLSGERRVLSDL
jgi:hypothetical protein